MKRILVTGGCGFIGANFVRQRLLKAEEPSNSLEKLVNVDLLTYAGNPENLEDVSQDSRYVFSATDIGDEIAIKEILEAHRIDGVVNFAAESHVDRSIDSPEPFFQTNVLGTLRLLNVCRQYWKELDKEGKEQFRFLHVSTDEVYGTLEVEDPAFSETTPYAPNSPYAASKASSDHIVRSFFHTYAFPVLTTNCSNNYGPYQFPEKLIPLMVTNAIKEKELPIYGDGKNIRDWLYVEDHCDAIWQVMKKGRLGETYNVGGLCEKTNLEIVDTLCEALDKIKPLSSGESYKGLKKFVKDRPGHDRRYAIDCSKIDKELGWKPSVCFEEGLEKTIKWYLEHEKWCSNIASGTYQGERLGLKEG